jgi:hypothetical protein
MRKIFTFVAVLVLGMSVVGIALAQGQGHGPPAHSQSPHAPADGEIQVRTGDVEDHGDASQSYADAERVDSVTLPVGTWKITATGAVSLTGDPVALNCGLRVEDDESATDSKMIAKQNPAVGGETGRVGFSVVGALEVYEDTVEVELVCYGGGNLPFEHNLVAIGG